MYYSADPKSFVTAHNRELLQDAEMQRLRRATKIAKQEGVRSEPWVSISTMLRLRK